MKRIQRQRTKGWRMPEGAVYVGRPSRWGNPWRVRRGLRNAYRVSTPAIAVERFRYRLASLAPLGWFEPLRGHDLACWCPLDQPCHADVLLELANREEERDAATPRCRWCRRPLPIKEGLYWLDDRGRYECPGRLASAHKPRIRDLEPVR